MKTYLSALFCMIVGAACDLSSPSVETVDELFGGAMGLQQSATGAGEASDAQEAHGVIDYRNDPSRMGLGFERRFAALPTQGETTKKPWTDTAWPLLTGGIGYRWQTDQSPGYESPSQETALGLSSQEIAKLSPAEKYDLYVGNYAYSLTVSTEGLSQPPSPADQSHCHGWSIAAIQFAEPSPVVVTNPDGIEIPFGSSDIKALLTFFTGEVVQPSAEETKPLSFLAELTSVGASCAGGSPSSPECADVNPGALHMLLANKIGLRDQAFSIDTATTSARRNRPVHSYSSEVIGQRSPSPNASPDAQEELVVRSAVTYTQQIDATWEPQLNTPGHNDHTQHYTYTLELNSFGEIVGGQWVVLLADDTPVTLHEAWEHLRRRDEDGDGTPDLTTTDAEATLWQHFEFPDYAWGQESVQFSPTPFMPHSSEDFVPQNLASRERLYRYFSKLAELYELSTGDAASKATTSKAPTPFGSPSYW